MWVCVRAVRYAVCMCVFSCGQVCCVYMFLCGQVCCVCMFSCSQVCCVGGWVWVWVWVFSCGQVCCVWVCFRAVRYAVGMGVCGRVLVRPGILCVFSCGQVCCVCVCGRVGGCGWGCGCAQPLFCVCWSADKIKYAESIFVVRVLVCRSDQVCRVHLRCVCAGLQIRSSMQSPSSLCVCWSADQIKYAESIFVVRVLVCRSDQVCRVHLRCACTDLQIKSKKSALDVFMCGQVL